MLVKGAPCRSSHEMRSAAFAVILSFVFVSVDNESVRGGFMLCFLDDGEGMDPGGEIA